MWKQLKKSCHTKKRISLVITYDIIWHNMTQPYEMVRPLPRVSGALISILRDALRNLRNFGNPEIFSRKMGETMPGMPQGCHMIHWNILKLSTNVGKSGAISHWPIDRLRARSSESPLAHVSIAHHGQNEVTTRFSLTHFLISKPNSLCWLIRLSHVITSLSHFRIHQGTSYLSRRIAWHKGKSCTKVWHSVSRMLRLRGGSSSSIHWPPEPKSCGTACDGTVFAGEFLGHTDPPPKKKNISTFYLLYTKKSMSMHIWYKCIPTSR